MNNAATKYLAETLRLVALGQLAAFGFAGARDIEANWSAITLSMLAAGFLIGLGMSLMNTLKEDS